MDNPVVDRTRQLLEDAATRAKEEGAAVWHVRHQLWKLAKEMGLHQGGLPREQNAGDPDPPVVSEAERRIDAALEGASDLEAGIALIGRTLVRWQTIRAKKWGADRPIRWWGTPR